ncbi:hypothetical protein IAT40_007003 [Kwoniella sp. CBS 6097]
MSTKLGPKSYKATKNEVGVFTTPGYSDDIKPLWKFKNAEEAGKSAKAIWSRFEGYRDQGDFIGMDICRKFIQMGRTRSLRYALRKGGRKYDPSTGEEKERTGKVYDQGKLDGANIYEKWLDRCWANEEYSRAWEEWKQGRDVLASNQRGDHEKGEVSRRSKCKGNVTADEESGSEEVDSAQENSEPEESVYSASERKEYIAGQKEHTKKRKSQPASDAKLKRRRTKADPPAVESEDEDRTSDRKSSNRTKTGSKR